MESFIWKVCVYLCSYCVHRCGSGLDICLSILCATWTTCQLDAGSSAVRKAIYDLRELPVQVWSCAVEWLSHFQLYLAVTLAVYSNKDQTNSADILLFPLHVQIPHDCQWCGILLFHLTLLFIYFTQKQFTSLISLFSVIRSFLYWSFCGKGNHSVLKSHAWSPL